MNMWYMFMSEPRSLLDAENTPKLCFGDERLTDLERRRALRLPKNKPGVAPQNTSPLWARIDGAALFIYPRRFFWRGYI